MKTPDKLKLAYRLIRSNPSSMPILLRNRFRSTFRSWYQSSDGFSPSPEVVTIEVTNKCNLKCYMCYQARSPEEDTKLSASQLKRVIDEMRRFKPAIQITGGEPLLYDGILDLVGYVKKKGLICMMNTNGIVLEEYAKQIVKLRIDKLAVSLDGPMEANDRTRGMRGAYEKTMSGINELVRAKSEKGLRTPLIQLMFTITNLNYEYLESMADISRTLSADLLCVSHLWFNHPRVRDRHNTLWGKIFPATERTGEQQAENIDIVELVREIEGIKGMKDAPPTIFLPDLDPEGVKTYYRAPDVFLTNETCFHPWVYGRISPDGSVRLCPRDMAIEYVIGSIEEAAFMKIWNGRRAIEFRRTLVENGNFPVCSRCCGYFKVSKALT